MFNLDPNDPTYDDPPPEAMGETQGAGGGGEEMAGGPPSDSSTNTQGKKEKQGLNTGIDTGLRMFFNGIFVTFISV